MTVEVRSSKLRELVDEDVELEKLGSGFWFTEGPVWNPAGQCLLFSDVPASVRRRFDERDGIQQVASPTNKANGMTLDADGRLLVCEHTTSSVVRMDPDGSGSGREVLASHFGTTELNSPNDIVVRSDGSIYFTDNPAGRTPVHGLERECALDFNGVYRIPQRGGATQLLAADFGRPNGLCFSPDESILYVNDTPRSHVRAFDVEADGALANSRVLAEDIGTWDPVEGHAKGGHVDGMKCDALGNIWVTGPGGVWVISPDGEHLGTVHVPESVGNLHWGGPSWDWIYLAATTSLFRLRTKVSGRLEPFMQ